MTDHTSTVLDLIDNAIGDYLSDDAMRWKPDAEHLHDEDHHELTRDETDRVEALSIRSDPARRGGITTSGRLVVASDAIPAECRRAIDRDVENAVLYGDDQGPESNEIEGEPSFPLSPDRLSAWLEPSLAATDSLPFYGLDLQPIDVAKWSRLFADPLRVVAQTILPTPRPILVSTVFMGMNLGFVDAAPILWESMVFGGLYDGEVRGYTSRVAAEAGHDELVALVKAHLWVKNHGPKPRLRRKHPHLNRRRRR